MAEESGKKRRTESKYVWRRLAAFALFLLLIAGIVLSLTVFFKLRVVQVRGTLEIYTREEISAASGLKAGTNMFRFSTQSVEKRIMRTLPYASEVKVTKKLPDKVLIEVKEADNALVLPYGDGVLVLSQDLTVIGKAGGKEALDKLAPEVEALNDPKAKFIKDGYQKALKEVEKGK